MAPSAVAITPPEGVKTSELTASAVASKLAKQATLQYVIDPFSKWQKKISNVSMTDFVTDD